MFKEITVLIAVLVALLSLLALDIAYIQLNLAYMKNIAGQEYQDIDVTDKSSELPSPRGRTIRWSDAYWPGFAPPVLPRAYVVL